MNDLVKRAATRAIGSKGGRLLVGALRQPTYVARVTLSGNARPDLAGLLWTPNDGTMRPADAVAANAELVQATLDDLEVPYTIPRIASPMRTVVAVPLDERELVVEGLLRRFDRDSVYVQVLEDDTALIPDHWGRTGFLARWSRRAQLVGGARSKMLAGSVLRVGRIYRHSPSGLEYSMVYGCDIEFWVWRPEASRWFAPRSNVAARDLSNADVTFAPRFREKPRVPSVFDRTMIDDIDFPVDVVYTWVDDSDPEWRSKLAKYREQESGAVHQQATAAERFRTRDELRYSLRSLSMYAPWVRHVYIVTDSQRPDFVDFDHDGITLVDHRDIAPDPGVLPVFNSNAIIGWLHRTQGLSEHYVYMNDDVFFGRPVAPELFFTPSGLCRVFPSRTQRPFGQPTPREAPHFNLTRNIRALLECEFGRTPSFSIRHTPHSQRVSIHQEMEVRFREALDRTSRSRFRHHEDVVADQLFHYYAQVTGRAVRAGIRYGYVNVGDRRQMAELASIESRSLDAFCLNDAPNPGEPSIPDEVVTELLERLFPVPSVFEP